MIKKEGVKLISELKISIVNSLGVRIKDLVEINEKIKANYVPWNPVGPLFTALNFSGWKLLNHLN